MREGNAERSVDSDVIAANDAPEADVRQKRLGASPVRPLETNRILIALFRMSTGERSNQRMGSFAQEATAFFDCFGPASAFDVFDPTNHDAASKRRDSCLPRKINVRWRSRISDDFGDRPLDRPSRHRTLNRRRFSGPVTTNGDADGATALTPSPSGDPA